MGISLVERLDMFGAIAWWLLHDALRLCNSALFDDIRLEVVVHVCLAK